MWGGKWAKHEWINVKTVFYILKYDKKLHKLAQWALNRWLLADDFYICLMNFSWVIFFGYYPVDK